MNILELKSFLSELLIEKDLPEFGAKSIALILLLIVFLVLGRILFWITRKIILSFFVQIAARTKSKFDDILINNKVPKILSYLPVLFLYFETIPVLFTDISERLASFIQNIAEALLIVLIIALIRATLKSVNDYLKTLASFKDKPLDSYLQVFMIFLWFVGSILIFPS